jgi:predicted nucleic acid-binding Zn ribbon protein
MLVDGEDQEVLFCPICGEQFIPKGRQVYCSHTCANLAYDISCDDEKFIAPKRKCHTCGKPTYDFECSACRLKRKAKGEWF